MYLLVCRRIKGAAENGFSMGREKTLGVLGLERSGAGWWMRRARNEGEMERAPAARCASEAVSVQLLKGLVGGKGVGKKFCTALCLSLTPKAVISDVGNSLPEGSVGEQSSQRERCTYVCACTRVISRSAPFGEKKKKKGFPLFLQ